MEKDRLNKMCQEVLGKSLDDVLKEFDEKIENESPISRSIPVMELKIVYLPGALMVQGRSDNIFGQVFGVEDQMQESFKRCTDMFQEEAVKITEKLGGVKGIKIFTNMNDFKDEKEADRKNRMVIKNWAVCCNNGNPFQDPQTMQSYLQGNVYGNPKFKDGDFVSTSRISNIVDCGDHKEVHTRSGSTYEIYENDVDPNYEEIYKDCYKKLGVENDR